METFKVGDLVFSKSCGKGVVVKIWSESNYPISVKFITTVQYADYTENGNFYNDNTNPLNINKTKLINTRYNQLKDNYV